MEETKQRFGIQSKSTYEWAVFDFAPNINFLFMSWKVEIAYTLESKEEMQTMLEKNRHLLPDDVEVVGIYSDLDDDSNYIEVEE